MKHQEDRPLKVEQYVFQVDNLHFVIQLILSSLIKNSLGIHGNLRIANWIFLGAFWEKPLSL